MLTTIALAVLTTIPAQPPELKLANVRLTVGELGPARESSRLIPGDALFIGYDIEGLTIDADGTARYTMAMEVTDSAGKHIFKQDPRDLADFVPLRGNRIPARAFIIVGLDQPPGIYSCKIGVTDPKTKATGNLNVKFEVLKKEFGIVALYTTHDARGEISAPTTGQVGQTLFINFNIASFERDAKLKQPDVEIEYQVFDDKNAPILGTPRKEIQDAKSARVVKDADGAFPAQFPLFLNRPGKFVFQIKATDRVSKKTATYRLPITVAPGN